MWETVSFMAGMVVLMMLIAILPHLFELPDAVANYFNRRQRRSAARLLPRDPDKQAARVLGESLRRAQLSAKATAQVMTAFWAADAQNRRALAYLVAGLAKAGPLANEGDLLVMLSSLPAKSEGRSEEDKKPSTSTDIRERPRSTH
jgi:hypothetical protein